MSEGAGIRPAPEVTIVGAGVIGMACAVHLQRAGLEVRVVDMLAPGEACSFGNAGALSPGSVAPLAMPGVVGKVPGWLTGREAPLIIRWPYLPRALPWLVRFVRAASPGRVERISHALQALLERALDAYEPLLEAAGEPGLVRRTGQLHVYPDQAARRADAGVWSLRRSRGVRADDLDGDGIRQLEPEIGPDYRCGLFLPDAATVTDPFRLVQALAERFRRDGGEIVRARVRRFEMAPQGPKAALTDTGALPVDRLVIAAGAWSRPLAAQLGSRVPLETQRGYHVTVADPGIALTRPVVAAEAKCFATSMDMGLRLAGTVEFAGLAAPPASRRAQALLRTGRRLLPRLRADSTSEWMGHRPCLPDSLPVIGPSPAFPQVFYAFGHGHLGLTMAAITGRLVADLVAGGAPPIDMTPYRADRF